VGDAAKKSGGSLRRMLVHQAEALIGTLAARRGSTALPKAPDCA
jgi:hypothetical protein